MAQRDRRRMKPSPLHLISAETAQLDNARTPNSRPTCFTSIAWLLYVKLELRAMTKSQRIRDSAVMISSDIAKTALSP